MSDHLLFSLNSLRYAVDASAVCEIVWLPELSSVEEAPPYIVGVLNLRGLILPVMSLDQRFHRSPKPVQLDDKLIVLQVDDIKMGIIVSEVHDVVHIAPEDIEPMPRYNHHADDLKHFISNEAKVDGLMWMLLDLHNLIDAPDFLDHAAPIEHATHDLFCDLPAPVRELFQRRATLLAPANEMQSDNGLKAFAIVRLGMELYAVAVDQVCEFCHLQHFTPIPCCPDFVLGNMNLRGDILTLMDIHPVLGIVRQGDLTEVMVVETDGVRVGLPVNEVLDVVYLTRQNIAALPSSSTDLNHDYCSNAIQYNDRIAGLLDVQALLCQGELEVNEEV